MRDSFVFVDDAKKSHQWHDGHHHTHSNMIRNGNVVVWHGKCWCLLLIVWVLLIYIYNLECCRNNDEEEITRKNLCQYGTVHEDGIWTEDLNLSKHYRERKNEEFYVTKKEFTPFWGSRVVKYEYVGGGGGCVEWIWRKRENSSRSQRYLSHSG